MVRNIYMHKRVDKAAKKKQRAHNDDEVAIKKTSICMYSILNTRRQQWRRWHIRDQRTQFLVGWMCRGQVVVYEAWNGWHDVIVVAIVTLVVIVSPLPSVPRGPPMNVTINFRLNEEPDWIHTFGDLFRSNLSYKSNITTDHHQAVTMSARARETIRKRRAHIYI